MLFHSMLVMGNCLIIVSPGCVTLPPSVPGLVCWGIVSLGGNQGVMRFFFLIFTGVMCVGGGVRVSGRSAVCGLCGRCVFLVCVRFVSFRVAVGVSYTTAPLVVTSPLCAGTGIRFHHMFVWCPRTCVSCGTATEDNCVR